MKSMIMKSGFSAAILLNTIAVHAGTEEPKTAKEWAKRKGKARYWALRETLDRGRGDDERYLSWCPLCNCSAKDVQEHQNVPYYMSGKFSEAVKEKFGKFDWFLLPSNIPDIPGDTYFHRGCIEKHIPSVDFDTDDLVKIDALSPEGRKVAHGWLNVIHHGDAIPGYSSDQSVDERDYQHYETMLEKIYRYIIGPIFSKMWSAYRAARFAAEKILASKPHVPEYRRGRRHEDHPRRRRKALRGGSADLRDRYRSPSVISEHGSSYDSPDSSYDSRSRSRSPRPRYHRESSSRSRSRSRSRS